MIVFKEGCFQDFDGARKEERKEIGVFLIRRVVSKTILNSLDKHLQMRRNDLQPWRRLLTGLICSVSEFKSVGLEGLTTANIFTYTSTIQRYVFIKVSVMSLICELDFGDAGI